MPLLTSKERKLLDDACVQGRRTSEKAVRAALGSLAIASDRPPAHLSEAGRRLRRALRAKSRQLGDQGDSLDLLIADCAYEQWHRLLFVRFLAENNLLIHPEYRAPVTLDDCDELADSLDEPDGWAVAGRFAAEILPGIFRVDDPCVQLRLPPEGRLALEGIVGSLPVEIFIGDDALGWVYQSWQKEPKDEVNDSERKVGGADLGPVTQLFTENYMVRFLLENSLGAWWATRHPNSPIVKECEYLRFADDRMPAVGSFEGWPRNAAEVTVMDPCCGSGHFLIEAFRMLWRMRSEEEGLTPIQAQDAVLTDNLFGLELDSRCVQIATFALALDAWKTTSGWRRLPQPHITCSGVPTRVPAEEWRALAKGDSHLENALMRLHVLFKDADTLGSLIDPKRAVEMNGAVGAQTSLDDMDWDDVAPLVSRALAKEASDPAMEVFGAGAADTARAAEYLSRGYTLVVTNVPYLTGKRQDVKLFEHVSRNFPMGKADLATAFVCRAEALATGSYFLVTPENWLTLTSYKRLRESLLSEATIQLLARLGPGAFNQISGEVVKPILVGVSTAPPGSDSHFLALDTLGHQGVQEKAAALIALPVAFRSQAQQRTHPDSRILLQDLPDFAPMSEVAECWAGIQTGDYPRFGRKFWEVRLPDPAWSFQQSTVPATTPYGGREHVLLWEQGKGRLETFARENRERLHDSHRRGSEAWGRRGIAVSAMGNLPVSIYTGELFDNNVGVISPHKDDLVAPLWHFCASDEFRTLVRTIDNKMNVTNRTLAKVPFDESRWRQVAAEEGDLPEPSSSDPTQWLFEGRPELAADPLQVGVARLLGYQWPRADADDLDVLADHDGIVCLPTVRGERPASERLQELLARACGGTWSTQRSQQLLLSCGSKKNDLDSWLREDFFKAHCQRFANRPFIWQIWDGRKEGFSALVNYHKLSRQTLEKLTYSYLGDWIERQAAGVRDGIPGAEERLAAARGLQQRLELILEGEPPYDIYVRWKSLAEQPIGWEPDLNDGVRLNVRPFVEAGVLRAKFNLKWDKDRGKNPDGSERFNDLHYTLAQKQAPRGGRA